MGRTRIFGLGVLALAALAACSEEDPTTLGAGVVDPGFRTFEVVLDAEAFLQADTTFDRIGSIHAAPFALVAHEFEGELEAHTLFRVQIPDQVTWQDTAGNTLSDSVFHVVGATVTVVLDSLRDETAPVSFEVLELIESWDEESVTWEMRFDTAGVSAPWTEPGGTADRLLGTTTLSAGDTVTIPLDSAAAVVWTDSAAAFHGGLLRATTPGSRLRIESMGFKFDVRPESQDTVVTAGSVIAAPFIVDSEPDAAAADELRVGGVPSWRSALQFRPLADVEIPCAPDAVSCTIPLREVTVNLASLLLAPRPVGARRVERPYRVEGRAVLRAPGVPLSRSAMTGSFGRMAEAIEPARFLPGGGGQAAIPVTSYVRQNIAPTGTDERILWVALITESERSNPVFGYGSFGSLRSATAPRLQLVVTAPIREDSP